MNNFPDFSAYNYQIVEELGRNREGGRISYLANCLNTGLPVVIKQFRFVESDATWTGFKAYEREIQILENLNHPRIPHYLASFETEDGFCMVQEYKDALSLAKKSHFSPEEVKKIAVSVLEILVDLQRQKSPIIHRDIKPENILVDQDLNAYLIDFGVAHLGDSKVAISSVAAGTPGFMPPEELFNRPLTEASDLYSLGATLISLLTQTPSANISRLINEDYQFKFAHLLPKVNPDFVDWLTKMVEPLPKNRYPNALVALDILKWIDINQLSPFRPKSPVFYSISKLGIVFIGFSFLIGVWVNFNKKFSVDQTSVVTTNINPSPIPETVNLSPEEDWFKQIKPHCNSVEVTTAMQSLPPINTPQGKGFGAACYALAGKIEQADQLIESLPKAEQFAASSIVFAIGHPVADAGDDQSAGPIMELVIKYQPDNFMAVYHAGMSEYVLKDYAKAKANLTNFLKLYQQNDGWRSNAIEVLNRMNK